MSIILLAACAAAPSHRDAAIDAPVRFRTTYYFRAFDVCERRNEAAGFEDARAGTAFEPRSDALYRFHLTGRASGPAERVHFEAGILRQEQIDPFGATMSFDGTSERHDFKSPGAHVLPCRRGFQVLGPEGWRDFDPDERLLLAMSVPARPLIGMLQDLSGRMLNARRGQVLLPLVQEQLRTREALDVARAQQDAEAGDATAALNAIIDAFNRGSRK